MTRPRALERPHATAFVGRRAELERIRASWAGVQMHRDRRLVLLAGEPGVGKTRLAHEFAAAIADGATVLLGRCSEEPLAPFEPFADALRQAGAADALQPGARRPASARGLVTLRSAPATACSTPSTPRSPTARRCCWSSTTSTGPTAARCCSRASCSAPLAPDRCRSSAPTATPSSAAAARSPARSPTSSATARSTASGCADSQEDDVAELARSLLGDDEVAARVHARTGGNAFFVEEVLRGLAEAGTPEVPESVRHAVGVRLRGSATPPTSYSPSRPSSASSRTRARCRPPRVSSPTSRRPRSTRSSARACSSPPPRRGASSSRTRSCARRCSTSSTSCAASGCTGAPRTRSTGLGENRHLEEIASHLFEAADAQRAADDARPRGPPRARPPRLRGRGRALRPRARRARARRCGARGRPGPARPRRRAAARRRARRGARSVH